MPPAFWMTAAKLPPYSLSSVTRRAVLGTDSGNALYESAAEADKAIYCASPFCQSPHISPTLTHSPAASNAHLCTPMPPHMLWFPHYKLPGTANLGKRRWIIRHVCVGKSMPVHHSVGMGVIKPKQNRSCRTGAAGKENRSSVNCSGFMALEISPRNRCRQQRHPQRLR